ncbi:hypothetical protein CAPTEDRAFT_189649 [Capitella teleta]|uniref:Menorin-like domain-containing protein n=1 Tax=Capitella teleta TaxID=283909 RepID=R7T618_CAPTE|nr:hypothetical protein CAPTEDRAFT_189649 [Capitella teleta]|eukprot:ELT88790.1 hypothetical protein CAPTEDRAFT_189649 [Capitella teleta]
MQGLSSRPPGSQASLDQCGVHQCPGNQDFRCPLPLNSKCARCCRLAVLAKTDEETIVHSCNLSWATCMVNSSRASRGIMSYSGRYSSSFPRNHHSQNQPQKDGFQQDLEKMAQLACLGFLGAGPQARRMKKFLFVQWTILIIVLFIWWKHNGGLLPHYSTFSKSVTPNTDMLEYFKIKEGDASLISWEQGIRSKEELQKRLLSDVMMFEVSVSLRGYGTAKQEMLPIVLNALASEELPFRDWLMMVIEAKKGFKINFGCIEAVDISLQYLVEFQDQVSVASVLRVRFRFDFIQLAVPIHLSAAVLNGPNAEFSTSKPLDASRFIHLCSSLMPRATLSLGWTSKMVNGKTSRYSWTTVMQMFDLIHDAQLSLPISLNLESEFVSGSIQQLKWLMQMTNTTLHIYLNSKNLTPAVDILAMRKQFPKNRLYYIGLSDVLSKVRSLENEQPEKFRDNTFILKADLWQVHSMDNMEMLMASESFLIKHGILESVDDLYPNEHKSRLIQTTVEFTNPENVGEGLNIYLHGLLGISGVQGIRCSIRRDGLMLLTVDGVNDHRSESVHTQLSGTASCFRISIFEVYNRLVKFKVQRPLDCSFAVIEQEQVLSIPIAGFELKSGRLFLSKADDSQYVAIDRIEIS